MLHFDIKTLRNYGDTLLFECVRHLFNGFGSADSFSIAATWPLRHRVGPSLIDRLNSEYDAAIVGGGGLFLRDTNENDRSGWQWDISLEQLRRLERPLVLFAIGYNRFFGQHDFAPVFTEHLREVARHAAFFGLRNQGSIEQVRAYLLPEQRAAISYQACPTVHLDRLFPDLVPAACRDERVLGVQFSMGDRERLAGFDTTAVGRKVVNVLQRLRADRWTIEAVTHVPADRAFAEHLVAAGIASRRIDLPTEEEEDPLFGGVRYYSTLPMMLGNRGHAQLIPFGVGGVPISVLTHPKLAYFSSDIGRRSWSVDPRRDDFEAALFAEVSLAFEGRAEHRAHMRSERDRLWGLTIENLAMIRRLLGVDSTDRSFVPYCTRERRLATTGFVDARSRWKEAAGRLALTRQLALVEADRTRLETDLVAIRQELERVEVVAQARADELVAERERRLGSRVRRLAQRSSFARASYRGGRRAVATVRSWVVDTLPDAMKRVTGSRRHG